MSGTAGTPPQDPIPHSDQAAPTGGGSRWEMIVRGTPLQHAVDLVQYGVALVLLGIAVVVLIRTAVGFLGSPGGYPQSLISAIDGVLVVIIVVDVLRTVLTSFQSTGLPLRPFLIIGIISAVRDILSVSARLSLQGPVTGPDFTRSIIELAVSGGVALGLAGALFLTKDVDISGHSK
ncbi:MAG: phosphate-starvation-inducible PsiE family protein [Candidatus Dormibacteria bacterium]